MRSKSFGHYRSNHDRIYWILIVSFSNRSFSIHSKHASVINRLKHEIRLHNSRLHAWTAAWKFLNGDRSKLKNYTKSHEQFKNDEIVRNRAKNTSQTHGARDLKNHEKNNRIDKCLIFLKFYVQGDRPTARL